MYPLHPIFSSSIPNYHFLLWEVAQLSLTLISHIRKLVLAFFRNPIMSTSRNALTVAIEVKPFEAWVLQIWRSIGTEYALVPSTRNVRTEPYSFLPS